MKKRRFLGKRALFCSETMLLLRYWLVKEMEKEVLTLHGNKETGFYVVNAELVSKAQYEPMLLWIAYVCFVCYQDPLVESGFFYANLSKFKKTVKTFD